MINLDALKDIGMGKIIDEKCPDSRFKNESELQNQEITDKTVFLYCVKRDIEGYRAGWIWSENKNDLIDYLMDNLIARQLFLEECTDPNNSDGYIIHNLQEAFLLSMANAFMKQNLDPEYYGDFSAAVSKLGEAVDNGTDLNIGSIELMDFTASFFFSLTWSFFENVDDAKAALKSHMVSIDEDLTKSLIKDKTL